MDGRALVGREHELEELGEAIRGVSRGERGLLVLTGEPGIGKTRMLEELAARIIGAGGIAAWGRVWEVGLTPPFWPWIQLLAALETPGAPAPSLDSLAPHTDAATRLARFGEVSSFLVHRAAAAPIALLFDDVHAADLSSLQLLEYVLPVLTGRRVLVALAARDTDMPRATAGALAKIQRGARRLPLARLALAEVQTLVGIRGDARRLFYLSEGNPLFVEELLASQTSRGVFGLPRLSSVRSVIRERMDHLPPATRETLRAAAILGREFRGQLVADMIGQSDVATSAEPAILLGMLVMTSPDRFRFSHALVAEGLADDLAPSERARLHLRAAEAIERRNAGELSAIAHHLLAAGHLAGEAAVSAAERAAQQCMAQLAFEDAAALLDRALQALALAAPADRRHRAAILCARAEALQHAAQHSLAVEICDEAAAMARELDTEGPGQRPGGSPGDPVLLARIALTRGLEFRFGRTDPVLVSLLREALDRLGDRAPSLRAKLLARLAAAEQPAPDPETAIARALEAIRLADELAPRDRLDVMYVATAALVDYVEPHSLERIHDKVLALARGTDRWISVHTRLRLCFTALERLDRHGFDRAVEAFAAEATALGLPQWTRHVHMLGALTALLEGRFDDAERAAAQSDSMSQALGDGGAAWAIDVHRCMAAWVKGAPVDPVLKLRIGNYVPGRAAIAAWFGVQENALEATRAALAELDGHVPRDPDLASMVASAAAFAGGSELSAKVYDILGHRSGRIVLASMVGFAVMDLNDRMLLVLAAACGHWHAIDEHGARALAIADKLGSPPWAARVRADWADALEKRRREGDPERAALLRAQALAAGERLGMASIIARCRPSLAPPEPSVKPAAPRPDGAGQRDRGVQLERHGELWIVRGFGEEKHVKDSRGMQILARLVDEPGSALHVLDLVGAADSDGGDSGEALDARARAQYRARYTELAAMRDEAESHDDRGRIDRANAEIEALSSELERAFGLGGRARRVGAASERARSNVQRRIAHAIGQIRAASPRMGEHLTATIRTGTYCVYEP